MNLPLDGGIEQLHTVLIEQGMSFAEAEETAPSMLRLRDWAAPTPGQTALERLTADLQGLVTDYSTNRRAVRQPALWHEFMRLLWIARLQVLVLRPAFWLSSAVIALLGALVVVARPESDRTLLLYVLAPLVGYASVAIAFQGIGLGLLECELACPPSARQLMIARLTIVLAYSLGLGVSVCLVSGWHAAATLSVSWLAPLLAEVGLTLLLSIRIATERAAAIVYAGWVTVLAIAWIAGLRPAPSTDLVNVLLLGVGILGLCAGIYLAPRIVRSRSAFAEGWA